MNWTYGVVQIVCSRMVSKQIYRIVQLYKVHTFISLSTFEEHMRGDVNQDKERWFHSNDHLYTLQTTVFSWNWMHRYGAVNTNKFL